MGSVPVPVPVVRTFWITRKLVTVGGAPDFRTHEKAVGSLVPRLEVSEGDRSGRHNHQLYTPKNMDHCMGCSCEPWLRTPRTR